MGMSNLTQHSLEVKAKLNLFRTKVNVVVAYKGVKYSESFTKDEFLRLATRTPSVMWIGRCEISLDPISRAIVEDNFQVLASEIFHGFKT